MNNITLDLYKGSNISKGFEASKPSIEDLEKSLVSNFDSGNIDSELFCKAMDELDLMKGKKALMGEEREWGGEKYKKTVDGWVSFNRI